MVVASHRRNSDAGDRQRGVNKVTVEGLAPDALDGRALKILILVVTEPDPCPVQRLVATAPEYGSEAWGNAVQVAAEVDEVVGNTFRRRDEGDGRPSKGRSSRRRIPTRISSVMKVSGPQTRGSRQPGPRALGQMAFEVSRSRTCYRSSSRSRTFARRAGGVSVGVNLVLQ